MRDFLEGERGRGYTARRNPAVTHGRIELFIVMAACSTASSSLCVGVRGKEEEGGAAGGRGALESLRFGRTFSFSLPPLSAAAVVLLSLSSLYALSRALALPVGHFGIYKYRYQALSVL